MKTIVLAAFFSTGEASRVNSVASFQSFAEKHQRVYELGSDEYKMRRSLFKERLASVESHNNQKDRLWTAGINKLSDWTKGELQSLSGWDGSARPASSGHTARRAFLQQEGEDDDSELPNDKMWTDLSSTRHIRNQGDCGSCWAIAVATVLEAHAEINNRPRSFSAQQIVECTPNPRHCGGDGGCQGATAELAMDYVLKNGIAEESAVPYTAHDAPCGNTDAGMAMAQVFGAPSGGGGAAFGMSGWETLPKNEYAPLVRALAQRGPVAVSVAADAWFNYESGIFNGCEKDAVIDHAVTAVGYGEENGVKYWTIQNSWGTDWGEIGHIRLERHADGDYCGTNNDPEKGIACKGETAPVPVCGMCGVLFDSVVPHFQA